MLFGNRSTFAIEAHVEEGLVPPSAVWGRMCLWLRNGMIGDLHDPHCGLHHPMDRIRKAARNHEGLWEQDFDGLADEACFHLFDQAIYLGKEEIRDPGRFAKHDFLTNTSECFDRTKSFIAFDRRSDEFLVMVRQYCDDMDDKLIVRRIQRIDFIVPALAFANWYYEEDKRLRRPARGFRA